MATKKEKIEAIRKELSYSTSTNGFVKNVGKVFFQMYGGACVMRDLVYYGSIRHNYDFELLSLDAQYFAGSKEHAEALQSVFGGKVYPSEYCYLAENARELYIWEKPVNWQMNEGIAYNPNPLDYDEAVDAIFS